LLHPVPFVIMAFITFAMMVDFCFFREQMCLIACPYGRFQSVLLDKDSLIVAYDEKRGEPRGKKTKAKSDSLPVVGDCIDCKKCVTTCPTGIDIRQGLQMECINCTQCIDACNTVMKAIGRAPDLIRYSSQSKDEGLATTLVRARTIIYPLLLLGIATAFFTVFFMSKTFDAVLIREPGNPHTMTEDGLVRNVLKLKITNRTDDVMSFDVDVESPQGATIEQRESELSLKPRETRTFHIELIAPRDVFFLGRANSRVVVANQKEVSRTLKLKMIGPFD